jgi:hypothetical protein
MSIEQEPVAKGVYLTLGPEFRRWWDALRLRAKSRMGTRTYDRRHPGVGCLEPVERERLVHAALEPDSLATAMAASSRVELFASRARIIGICRLAGSNAVHMALGDPTSSQLGEQLGSLRDVREGLASSIVYEGGDWNVIDTGRDKWGVIHLATADTPLIADNLAEAIMKTAAWAGRPTGQVLTQLAVHTTLNDFSIANIQTLAAEAQDSFEQVAP